MGIIALPSELVQHLVTFCHYEEFKTCRLVSRALHIAATPLLFETVHLSPSTLSFARAKHIASSPFLSSLVRNVIYHLGVLDEHEHGGFQFFRDWTMKLKPPRGTIEEQTEEVLWRYHCLLEEHDAQLSFRSEDEYEALRAICHNLINLEGITTVLDGYEDPFAIPTDYIGRRTGWRSVEAADGSHLSNLYRAASGNNMRRIHALYNSWLCLVRIHDDLPVDSKSPVLNEMRLCLFNSEYFMLDSGPKATANAALDAVLTWSAYAETLSFDFDEIPNDLPEGALLPISLSISHHSWPRLRSLELMGLTVLEDELVEFLHRHQPTLRRLHLDDIVVCGLCPKKPDEKTTRPGSVISLFQKLRDVLNVESLTLTGIFTNDFDEYFWVDTTHQPAGCIVLALQEWLSGGENCPIPQNVLEAAHHPRRFPLNVEDGTEFVTDREGIFDAMGVFEGWNDSSWIWSPE